MVISGVFSEARARTLLAQACLSVGLPDPTGARLLSLGENAVFDLGFPALVAKVGRDGGLRGRAARELAVARWLDSAGIPVPRPADGPIGRQLEGVVAAAGHPVTFWHRLTPATRPADPADLGRLLRALHLLAAPALPEPLPRRELLAPVERWLAAAGDHLDPADAAYLLARRAELADAIAELVPVLPAGVIHGDALPRNVHVGASGPILLDLETFAEDLREHDLVPLALSHDRYGVPKEQYRAFTLAYGWDVRDWAGCAALRAARETASAAWVAQQLPGSPAARTEFRRRVDSLRAGDGTVRWYAF
ncbi:aminoglycoside phosphotransferase family protein [Kitasatospora sp. NBC_01287]|uniref:phosphotransferase n=1 Tax=Kitasatospora sp. NBC_01287 TaxID=2903573 RepID=UPI002252CFB1|nr:aminoglycoside phosphotransferase family protein [Kitasatospora sp. NBC_01287]MCX4749727.1 aminoglycoside phosphotransferase family protein [Kitasatospora sp. NBC_01287]